MVLYFFIYTLLIIVFPIKSFYTSDDISLIKSSYFTKVPITFFDKAQNTKYKKLPFYKDAFWWQIIPTTGLCIDLPKPHSFLPHQFTLWQLAPLQGKGVTIALFDTKIHHHSSINIFKNTHILKDISIDNNLPFYDHATHTAGLICAKNNQSGGISGIAPEATLLHFKVLNASGKPASLLSLIAAVEKAIDQKSMIANISFTFDEYDDPTNKQRQKLEKLLHEIPYVICATGNKGKKQKENFEKRISYPARIKTHVISVGSFECTYNKKINMYECCVSPFSQYEPHKGPQFLAPGKSILSCSCRPPSLIDTALNQTDVYAFHTGTSCSAAIVSGFFALIIGEFKTLFSYEQILYVCQLSSSSLSNSPEWNIKSLYGALDMRTALFILHVLKSLTSQQTLKNMPFIIFKKYVQNIKNILFFQIKYNANLSLSEHINAVKIKVLECIIE